ncbi:effector-associated constant component EACC1 [Nocardia sp. NPDC004340]
MAATITISITDADDDIAELASLFEAIVVDDDLRAVHKRLISGEPVPDALGATELIKLVVESAPLMGAVTACVTAWIASRTTKFTLKIGDSEISVKGDVSEAVVRQALEQIRPNGVHNPDTKRIEEA